MIHYNENEKKKKRHFVYFLLTQGSQGQPGPPGPPGTAGTNVSEIKKKSHSVSVDIPTSRGRHFFTVIVVILIF